MKFMMALSLIGFALNSSAQNLQLLSSSGGTDRTDQIQLDWSLGEFVTNTAYSKNNIYTQGFHQSYNVQKSISGLMKSVEGDLSNLSVSPNPASSYLNLYLQDTKDEVYYASFSNVYGGFMHSQEIRFSDSVVTMDIHSLLPGIYILTISEQFGKAQKSFKILKIN